MDNIATGDGSLRKNFIEPPFSILDAKSTQWQQRKKQWYALGLASDVGRDFEIYKGTRSFNHPKYGGKTNSVNITKSVFDPALCEVIYKWFCPDNGLILDPFAGGSVRGIVANYMGYQYTGIDIRPIQIAANQQQARKILSPNNQPIWITGDSNTALTQLSNQFDFLFSCPPYFNLERYSRMQGDISNLSSYDDFMTVYRSIIAKSCARLKQGSYAVFVVGEVRDKRGNYLGFVPDTITAFKDCGLSYYNDIILSTMYGTAALRAGMHMRTRKVVKVHQNVLVFKKP